MTVLEASILDVVRTLSASKQEKLLHYAQTLHDEARPPKPRQSGKGLWADFPIALTAEDIEENQREMWKDFPRGDI